MSKDECYENKFETRESRNEHILREYKCLQSRKMFVESYQFQKNSYSKEKEILRRMKGEDILRVER